jgi:hypothetical protein
MTKIKAYLMGSLIAMGAVFNSQAELNGNETETQKVVRNQILCEKTGHADDTTDCKDVNAQFESLKRSSNIELIYEIYKNEKVQMEMEFSTHGNG